MSDPIVTVKAVEADDSDRPSISEHDFFDEKRIGQLGRQRPAVFSSLLVEIGFVFAIVGSLIMSLYTVSGINIILPSLIETLDIPESKRIWPVVVTSLTTSLLPLLFARLSDCYGGRVVFLGGHIWLLISSLICGFSENTTMLIVCRAMQGLGSSAFLPASVVLLGHTYRPGSRKNFVFGLYGASGCVGIYFGIIMGAVSAQVLGWQWYFWIGCVCGCVLVLVGRLSIPSNLKDANSEPGSGISIGGLILLTPGLVLTMHVLIKAGHVPKVGDDIFVSLFFAIFLLMAYLSYQQKDLSSSLPTGRFRPMRMLLVLCLFIEYGIFGLYLYYASSYINTVLKATPLQAAVWFAPLPGWGLVLALTGGFVLHKISCRTLMIISNVGFLISAILFATIPEQRHSTTYTYWAYVFPSMLFATIGIDIAFKVTIMYFAKALARRLHAAGGALLFYGIAFWMGVGELAVFSTIRRKGRDKVDEREQLRIAFWVAAGLAVAVLCLALMIKLERPVVELTADDDTEQQQRPQQIQLVQQEAPADTREREVRLERARTL
ncbi:drug resistance [Fusarium albosuccineum]|uniref:Drug resistance n=1 Tax=Fusarium albosuccineum TaxID=1237068 RepID=A0A8H4PHE9_9HYPO|nr:drug resistance [Fusarium albosuccineum]